MNKPRQHDIVIDCAPGCTRPGAFLKDVLEGTGLTLGKPVSKLFGAWSWNVPLDQNDLYVKAHPLIVKRLKHLYNAGFIRAAEWSTP